MNCSETFKIYNSTFKIKKSYLEVNKEVFGKLETLNF